MIPEAITNGWMDGTKDTEDRDSFRLTQKTGESGVGDRELVESYLELFQPASDDDSLFFKGSIKTSIEGNSGDGYKIHFTRYESYKRKRSSDDGAGRLTSRQRSFQAIKF